MWSPSAKDVERRGTATWWTGAQHPFLFRGRGVRGGATCPSCHSPSMIVQVLEKILGAVRAERSRYSGSGDRLAQFYTFAVKRHGFKDQ